MLAAAFKGTPGWEFTPLPRGFSLDAFPPAVGGPLTSVEPAHVLPAARGRDRAAAGRRRDLRRRRGRGRRARARRSTSRSSEHPELVEPHLGSSSSLDERGRLRRRQRARAGRAARSCTSRAGVKVDVPILLTSVNAVDGTALHRRTLIVLEEGAEAEVWEQHLSADDDGATLLNTVVEIVVGQNARLRYVNAQDLNEKSLIVRQPARGRRARRHARLGRARLRLGHRPRAHGHDAHRPRRRGPRHRRLRAARAASTSTTTPTRSTRPRTASPTSPSAASSTTARRASGAG